MNDMPKRGFSMIELLVVIAIIGVLVGLVIAATQFARKNAQEKRVLTFAAQADRLINFDCVYVLDFDNNLNDRCSANTNIAFVGGSSNPLSVTGVDGNLAYQFASSPNRHAVRITNFDTSRMGGDYAIQFWVKPTDITGTNYIISSGDVNIYRSGANLVVDPAGSVTAELTATNVLAANTWTHILVSLDDTVDGTGNALYVNSEIKDTSTPTQLIDFSVPDDVFIGSTDGGTTKFRGVIDNVRFYTSPLPFVSGGVTTPTPTPT